MRIFGTTILGQPFFYRLSEHRLEQVNENAIRAEYLGSGFAPLDFNRAVEPFLEKYQEAC